MKFKTSVSLMIAVVLGLVTAYVGIDILKKAQRGKAASTRVVVAVRDLEPGYVLTEKDLKLEEVSSELAPEKSLRDAKLAAGRTVMATVVKGYPLLDNQLSAPGAGSGIAAMVPSGMRAVAVEVSEASGVAGLITPGCYVDVTATLRKGDQSIATTVVQRVKVHFVSRSRATRSSSVSASAGSPDALGPIKSVTLLVTPKQANALELAQNQGRLRLMLRGTADDGEIADATVSQNELLGLPDEPATKPEPEVVVIEKPVTDAFAEPPPPPKRRTVEFIRGGQSEMVEVDDEAEEEALEEEGNGAAPGTAKQLQSRPAGGGNSRTASGASPDNQAPRREAGSGNLRRGM